MVAGSCACVNVHGGVSSLLAAGEWLHRFFVGSGDGKAPNAV